MLHQREDHLGHFVCEGLDEEALEVVLQGADLTYARNLTREQLDEACGDDETELPDYLADYQLKPCPKPEQSPAN